MRTFIFMAALTALAACAGTGPSTSAITSASEANVVSRDKTESYLLIEVDSTIAERVTALSKTEPRFFNNVSPGAAVIGVGDTLQVSIVSTSTTGFIDFATNSVAPISSTPLPSQEVSETGTINVPPLGRVLARGKTVPQFEAFLTRKLGEVLVEPSVVVNLTNRLSARVSLIGDVGGVGTRPMNAVDTRLIDIIVSGGGPTGRPEDLLVTVSRRGHTASIPMQILFENPKYNIFVLPGDVISVEPPHKELLVLGAAGRARVVFNEASVSLADALASSGGLIDRRSDRKGVFLYRQAERTTVEALGADTRDILGATVPTIFRFDFTDPSVLFVASKFEIQDGDVLYVSNSLTDEINAVISAI